MKYLILLFPLVSFANLSFEAELERRLKLYGLKKSQITVETQTNSKREYNTSIQDILKADIKENFIPHIYEELGKCQDENCLIDNGDHKRLKTATKEVCLPYTRCGFYHCMEEKYQCEKEGVNYFTKLAFPTCSNYLSNIQKKKFTQKGYDWIYSVMVCLQKGLIDECELKDNCRKETNKKTCDYITKFTLEFHPGCYINSGVGVCNLPMRDKINIWRTVGKYLTEDEFKQAVATVKHCIRRERGMI